MDDDDGDDASCSIAVIMGAEGEFLVPIFQ